MEINRLKYFYKTRITTSHVLFFSMMVLFSCISWNPPKSSSAYKQTQKEWVDSIMQKMTEEEKIGQLFMVAAYSNRTSKHSDEIEALIKNHKIGGLIFFQGGPVRQALLTNKYQSLANVPLMIGMDAEWGLSMRLDSTIQFPKQMTLGAIQDDQLIYKMGLDLARQCKRLGVHVNFAPVVDINSNPNNPVIGMRSFGEDKFKVTQKGLAYMKGMQDLHVMASAKHFPGHGDTESDSHQSLPQINHDKERLHQVEFYPFKKLIADSVKSVMIAHLQIPAYDNTKNMPTTLSKAVVTDLLVKELGFKGLIFTDALNMKGVSSFYKPGDVDVKALMAGNDVLLYSEDVPTAIEKIQKAIKKGDITPEELDMHVRKILESKYWLGLNEFQPVELKNLVEDLNGSKSKALQQELYAAALTVINNKNNLIPIRHTDTTKFASVCIGLEEGNAFQNMLNNYATFNHFTIDKKAEEKDFAALLEKISKYDIVVIGLHNTNIFNSKHFGITENAKNFILQANKQNICVTSVFGNPYSIKFFTDVPNLICAFEDMKVTQKLVPQLIFGGLHANGKLPVTVAPKLFAGHGLETDKQIRRLGYAYPESMRMDARTLSYVDSICLKTIAENASPGCQVLICKEGKIIYEKSFGHISWDTAQKVNSETMYDIASVTKVAGTMQAFMFLEERGLIDLNQKASYYLPELIGTNKENLEIKDVLTHQAGLIPFLPWWKRTLDSTGFRSDYYRTAPNDTFNRMVIPGLYSRNNIEDSLWAWTIRTNLLQSQSKPVLLKDKNKKRRKAKRNVTIPSGPPKKEYVYSDLSFYIAKRIVESQLNQPIDEFLEEQFYKPMGLKNLLYKPLEKNISVNRIAPTEDDKYYRKTLVRGTVHDQGAALMGGVGGHAGLFGNAHDLAILMQMNLQKGWYGGYRFLLPETVTRFSKRQFDTNRRGLGWDKPEPVGQLGPTSYYAPSSTFGHTGFTGTCAWIDPDNQIVYIFLSNRIHPDAANNKLLKLGVRTAIQDVIYKSILNFRE